MEDRTKGKLKYHGSAIAVFTGLAYIVSLVIYLMLFWMVPWRVDWMELLFVMRLWVPVSIVIGVLCWSRHLEREECRREMRRSVKDF